MQTELQRQNNKLVDLNAQAASQVQHTQNMNSRLDRQNQKY
jgi:hypothetical protein